MHSDIIWPYTSRSSYKFLSCRHTCKKFSIPSSHTLILRYNFIYKLGFLFKFQLHGTQYSEIQKYILIFAVFFISIFSSHVTFIVLVNFPSFIVCFLGRPRRRWEDIIRMDFEEIGINAGNWVDSAQDRNY